MTVVDPLPAGSFTLTGKTNGPAINMGRCRYAKSQMMFQHLDELRDNVVKAGWHTEQDYQQLLSAHESLKEVHEAVCADLLHELDKSESLEKALGWKPTGDNQNGDGEHRERELPQGGTTRVAGSPAGAEDSSVKDGGGKGRKVRAKSAEAS